VLLCGLRFHDGFRFHDWFRFGLGFRCGLLNDVGNGGLDRLRGGGFFYWFRGHIRGQIGDFGVDTVFGRT